MTPSIGKKLSLFVGIVTLIVTGAMGYVSYRLLEARFADVLRKDTLDTATLLASRVRNELRHVAEKGRILSAAALEEFKNPDDQLRFLQDNLRIDDQFIALSLFRRSQASEGRWTPVFRLTRPDEDPDYISDADFKELDLKYPLDLGLVSEGAVDIAVGELKDSTPILRMAVPIVRKKGAGFTQLLEIEVRQERLTAAFAEATAHFSFLLDRNGRVLSQTDPTHFTFGEDLSHLPILQMARSTDAPNGNLDYYELPGGSLQFGSFHKVGYADLTVVVQAPRTLVMTMLRTYTRQAALMALACVLLASALALLACWGIVGSRLARLATVFRRVGDGNYAAHFPDTHLGDEVGSFARALQEVCDELKGRERVHGTFVKLKNRRIKNRIDEGKLNLKGERLKAIALHCHLHGIETVVAKADPELLVATLNRFNQAVASSIEGHRGIVDHIHGGSVVAYWGVPVAGKDDMDQALLACLEIRELAKRLVALLKKHRLPEVSLRMGMHYGTVVAGQVGTDDRLEYTALGEAVEVASRIQSFTDQFGTDFLITGPAVSKAPKWYSTEQVSSGDDINPDLFELVGSSKHQSIQVPPLSDDESGDETGAAPADEVASADHEGKNADAAPEQESAPAEEHVGEPALESAEPAVDAAAVESPEAEITPEDPGSEAA